MRRSLLVIVIIALYLLHQDFWFWRSAEPIVFGFLPIGLFYHICYTIAISALMWLLVRNAWPSRLEEGNEDMETNRLVPFRPGSSSLNSEEGRNL